MTHTVEGWAVQYKARNHKWCFDVADDGNACFYKLKKHADQHDRLLLRINGYRLTTRIVRVRQTTEVIDE